MRTRQEISEVGMKSQELDSGKFARVPSLNSGKIAGNWKAGIADEPGTPESRRKLGEAMAEGTRRRVEPWNTRGCLWILEEGEEARAGLRVKVTDDTMGYLRERGKDCEWWTGDVVPKAFGIMEEPWSVLVEGEQDALV